MGEEENCWHIRVLASTVLANVVGLNKVFGVDVSIFLHRWVFTDSDAALEFVQHNRVAKLTAVFRKIMQWLLLLSATLIIVFDGICPGKGDVDRKRAAVAEEARRRVLEMLEAGDVPLEDVKVQVCSSTADAFYAACTRHVLTFVCHANAFNPGD